MVKGDEAAGDWRQALGALETRESGARAAGDAAKRERLRASGRLAARERIEALIDPGSFVERFMLAEHRCSDFGMGAKRYPGDGVITGDATVAGRRICVYAQDAAVLGGSTGRVHGEKIHTLLKRARTLRVPVVGLHDSGGARIQEGMDNVFGMTGVFRENALNSGVVPQVVAVMGTCAGGAAYSAALADFIVQVEGTSQLFVTGPELVKEVAGETVSLEALGGAQVHAERSGVTHLTARDDAECLRLVRRLLGYLPQHNREAPPVAPERDAPGREVPELLDIVPLDAGAAYDMRRVVGAIADDGEFLEIQQRFAANLIVGFARIAGRVVGMVANNPLARGGYLDLDAADKAARFVRTCDAFNVPLVTLVDSAGFLPGVAQEHAGLVRHGAKLLHAWTESSVPKVACVLRKMYGAAIPAMGAREIGFDTVLAWPSAEMQMVRAEPAVRILCRAELERAADREALFAQRLREYRDLYLTPYHAASLAVVDAVIHPKDTRARIAAALAALASKQPEEGAWRKHANIPL